MTKNLIYVYCISNSPPELVHDMEPKGLKSLKIDSFYVIIKYVLESEFSEENFKKNLSDFKWVEHNTREHIMVIGRIMESVAVIPFKFGTIYNTKDGLEKFISDYSVSLVENFHNIEGKEEWSVKIYCNRKELSEQIDELSEEVASLEKQIMASSPGKAFLLKKKKTDMVENKMDILCKTYGQEYYNKFKSISESTILNNLLPKEFTGRDDSMILNAAFFINKKNITDFKRVIFEIKEKDENSGFIVDATGPWPPFSFISLKEI